MAARRTTSEALELARIHCRAGRWDLCLQLCEAIVKVEPHEAEALHLAGVARHQQRDLAGALDFFRRAAAVQPQNAQYQTNLGAAWDALGDLDRAFACFRRALELDPHWATAHYNAANILRQRGRLDEAEVRYRQAIRLAPAFAEAHCNLGGLLKEYGKLQEAAASYAEALRLKPDLTDALQGLGGLSRERADLAQAADCYQRALRLGPNPLVRFEQVTLLPAVYASADHLRQRRSQLMADLAQLAGDGVRLDLCKTTPHTLFHLAYQGFNDRPVHKLVAELASAGSTDLSARAHPTGARLRVGFVSKVLLDHTVGQLWQNMIAGLSHEKFAVSVWSPPADDAVARRIRARADHWAVLPSRPALARRQIAAAGLDVLVFPEVGMDPAVWALASTRVAPVQCAGWGHPVTTGFPTIDYFLSSRLLETAEADEHYTERLVRCDGFGLCVDRPQLPPPASRSDFGLPQGKRLYGCLQSLFKIHPDDDPLLAEVLRRDPGGELILLEGTAPQWRQALVERFAATMPDVHTRVHFLPRQTSEGFLRLAALMDVMLDPLHFSGGRTSYEALALGVPVVTLPSRLLRGRITLGVYRAMGVDGCIAADKAQYVDLAVRLAGAADFRQSMREKILAGCARFFNDRSAIRQFEEFLLHAAAVV